jgi:MFS family permease
LADPFAAPGGAVVNEQEHSRQRVDERVDEVREHIQVPGARSISRADASEIVLLLLLVFGGLSSEQAIGVLMPLAANAAGASYAWIGVLSGAVRLVLVLLLIPGTWLVASMGRRLAVVVGAGLEGAAALMYAVIPDVRWMLLPQIVLGVGLSLFWPAYLSYFAEVAAGAAIRMQARRSVVQGVALLVSPLIGTYLAGRFGYGAGFAVIGCMTVAAAVAGLRLSGPAGRPSGTPGNPAALLGTYRAAGTLFRRKSFALIVGLSILGSLLIYLVNGAFLTLHLRELGFASLTIGMLISLRSLSDVALRAAFSKLAIRFRPLFLVAFAAGAVALVDLFLPAFVAPAAVVVLMVLLGVLGSQYDPATTTVLSNLLRSNQRDVGIAVWVTINSLVAWAVAPLLGSLGDAAGLPAVFVVSACIGLVAVIALMAWGRRAAGKRDAADELIEMYWRGDPQP